MIMPVDDSATYTSIISSASWLEANLEKSIK